ncbi:hypothetical protein IT398_00305 [Candidatus Nomurabacteria bacterium]|nr:hypothetical protein [Candidatus Nomurabacteria bacterium]
MNRWLERFKKYFIPHDDNTHQPHFLREGSVVALLVLVVLIEAAVVIPSFFVLPRNGFLAAVLPEALVALTNETRQATSLPDLETNSLLTRAAQLKAEDMATRGYFSHQSPEGEEPWTWLDKVGYKFSYAGENLAVNFFDSRDVAEAWRRSPTHEANLIRPVFSEIGIGVAAGNYQGRNTLFVVQFFGKPAIATTQTLASINISESPDDSPRLNQVLGAAVAATKLSYWQILATRLHTVSSKVYYSLLALAIVAFLLNFFIRIKIQHPHIIVNGLLLILVLFGVLLVNKEFFVSKLQTSYLQIEAPLSQ